MKSIAVVIISSMMIPRTVVLSVTSAFHTSILPQLWQKQSILPTTTTTIIGSLAKTKHQDSAKPLLFMAASEDDGARTSSSTTSSSSQQRRRKRKKSSSEGDTIEVRANNLSINQSSNNQSIIVTKTTTSSETDTTTTTTQSKPSAKTLAREILAREQMMDYDEYNNYEEEDLTSFTPLRLEDDDRIAAAAQRAGFSISDTTQGRDSGSATKTTTMTTTQLEDLFDSREFLQRKREKQLLEENDKVSTGVPTKKKIKRSDIKAYNRLLEMDPIADEDNSYFEDEGIDFISALLGDVEPGVGNDSDESSNKTGKKVQKKTSFLGIGSGPLQVGHFIGALGVVLMAFVEYPGFPLTNLPDPLRASLQGGLGTIYLINTILAVLAAMSAPSRNQSAVLWGAKTFAVGGIAYDQLMQIPTPQEAAENARMEEEKLNRMRGRRGRNQKK